MRRIKTKTMMRKRRRRKRRRRRWTTRMRRLRIRRNILYWCVSFTTHLRREIDICGEQKR